MKRSIKWGNLIVILLLLLAGCRKTSIEHKPVVIGEGCYLNYNIPNLAVNYGSDTLYYDVVKDIDSYSKISNCDESSYIKLYKNKSITGLGDSSKFWRWNIDVSIYHLESTLNKTLFSLKNSNKSSVYILKNNMWSLDTFSTNSLGTLKRIVPIKRGESGVVMELLIEGSKNSFIVVKQDNIRKLFNFSEEISIPLIGRDNSVVFKNTTALPSGFFSIEKIGTHYHIYGGGYGHGVGMPQVTTTELVKEKGYDYRDILHRYYTDTEITDFSKLGISDSIKVGITKNSQLPHASVILSSKSNIEVVGDLGKITVEKDKKIEVVKVRDEIVVKVDGVSKLSSINSVDFLSKDKIMIESIKRSLKGNASPSYSGVITIRNFESSLMVVNTLSVEEYLKGVVPSEMSPSYGLEPLKAQSVAARTFAIGAILRKKYPKYNIDVLDTISDQVYNNLDESEIANRAIKESLGEILLYNGKPINAFFYSSSSGVSAVPKEVW